MEAALDAGQRADLVEVGGRRDHHAVQRVAVRLEHVRHRLVQVLGGDPTLLPKIVARCFVGVAEREQVDVGEGAVGGGEQAYVAEAAAAAAHHRVLEASRLGHLYHLTGPPPPVGAARAVKDEREQQPGMGCQI